MKASQKPIPFLRNLISFPFISIIIVPFVITDIFVEVYHRICFPLYKISYVKRSSYIKIDRHKLKYLRWYEKIGCAYCGYGNGLLHYLSEIAARTETYWCGIKHAKDPHVKLQEHQKDFFEYGDEEKLNQFLGR